MTGFSTNMFHVENFLCFISLRRGTIFLLYLTLIFSSLVFLLTLNFSISDSRYFLTSTIEGVTIIGVLVSGFALLHFPDLDKKYNATSVYAKCIKYFSLFSSAMAVLGFLVWISIIIVDRQDILTFVSVALNAILWIGMFIHFAAVAHSFYLSILQPDSDRQEGSVISNNIYDEALEKTTNVPLDEKNDTKPDTV